MEDDKKQLRFSYCPWLLNEEKYSESMIIEMKVVIIQKWFKSVLLKKQIELEYQDQKNNYLNHKENKNIRYNYYYDYCYYYQQQNDLLQTAQSYRHIISLHNKIKMLSNSLVDIKQKNEELTKKLSQQKLELQDKQKNGIDIQYSNQSLEVVKHQIIEEKIKLEKERSEMRLEQVQIQELIKQYDSISRHSRQSSKSLERINSTKINVNSGENIQREKEQIQKIQVQIQQDKFTLLQKEQQINQQQHQQAKQQYYIDNQLQSLQQQQQMYLVQSEENNNLFIGKIKQLQLKEQLLDFQSKEIFEKQKALVEKEKKILEVIENNKDIRCRYKKLQSDYQNLQQKSQKQSLPLEMIPLYKQDSKRNSISYSSSQSTCQSSKNSPAKNCSNGRTKNRSDSSYSMNLAEIIKVKFQQNILMTQEQHQTKEERMKTEDILRNLIEK